MFTIMFYACVLTLIALRTYGAAVFSTLAMLAPAMARKITLRILPVEFYIALLASKIAGREFMSRVHGKRRPWSGCREFICVKNASRSQQLAFHDVRV